MSSSLIDNEASPKSEKHSTPVRFHLSLNVSNLEASIKFFTAFLGLEPAKRRDDYAKFEVAEPPLVLSLEPSRPSGSGVLNHVGLRMPDGASLVAMQRRLEGCGIGTRREEGIECCYAKQTKFWLHDPDGTLWEVYTLDEDIEHHGYSAGESDVLAIEVKTGSTPVAKARESLSIWSHRLGQPIPAKLFVQPGTVDEIRLQGTFNMICSAADRAKLLAECAIALRPGGQVVLHLLTSDEPIEPHQLELSGAAAVVEQVLPISELVLEVEAAGLANIEFQKFDEHPCFVRQGRELRETVLIAKVVQPSHDNELDHRVFFKGPARELTIGDVSLARGTFKMVSERVAQLLQETLGDRLIVSRGKTS